MTELHDLPLRDRWARLRFAVVGPLLAAPPEPGQVRELITALAAKRWRHPVTGALFGRLGVLVVRTQLGFFDAPRLTKCIPLIDQVGDSAAFLSL